jgi:hypothetical protein
VAGPNPRLLVRIGMAGVESFFTAVPVGAFATQWWTAGVNR